MSHKEIDSLLQVGPYWKLPERTFGKFLTSRNNLRVESVYPAGAGFILKKHPSPPSVNSTRRELLTMKESSEVLSAECIIIQTKNRRVHFFPLVGTQYNAEHNHDQIRPKMRRCYGRYGNGATDIQIFKFPRHRKRSELNTDLDHALFTANSWYIDRVTNEPKDLEPDKFYFGKISFSLDKHFFKVFSSEDDFLDDVEQRFAVVLAAVESCCYTDREIEKLCQKAQQGDVSPMNLIVVDTGSHVWPRHSRSEKKAVKQRYLKLKYPHKVLKPNGETELSSVVLDKKIFNY